MIKIYGFNRTRWLKPWWLLRELDVPFEKIDVKLTSGEHFSPGFQKVNPFSKIPAIDDNGTIIFESTAICNYLADKYPEKNLIPKPYTIERAMHDQWMSFITCELEQPLWRATRHTFLYPEEKRSKAEIELAKSDFLRVASVLEKTIPENYLIANQFGVADICMTYTLNWSTNPMLGNSWIGDFPRLKNYIQKHMSRPGFPKE